MGPGEEWNGKGEEVEADQIRVTAKVGMLAVNVSPRCPLIPPASTWFAFAPSA